MAVRTSQAKSHISTRSASYWLGAGGDVPLARIVAVVLLLLPLVAYVVASEQAKEGPSEEARQIAALNPKQILADNTPHFLPKPVAAMAGDADAGPPPPAESEPVAAPPADSIERVKVANTGGVGAILRADPPRGRQVAGLRSGQLLEVLEHRTVDDTEWLHVRTPDGSVEGWIFARLVGPAQ
jgi:hypothetical protein